jgi:hypothetical protein
MRLLLAVVLAGHTADSLFQDYTSQSIDEEFKRRPYVQEQFGHSEYFIAEQSKVVTDGFVTGFGTVLPSIQGEDANDFVYYVKYMHADAHVGICKDMNVNHGSEELLPVRHYLDRSCVDQRTFFRFNVSDFSTATVQVAVIRFKAEQFDRGHIVHVVHVDASESWEEGGVTWRTQPKLGKPVCRWTRPKPARRGINNDLGHYECDVTNYVRAVAGHKNGGMVSFALTAVYHAQKRAAFWSREATREDLRPRMIIGALPHQCSRVRSLLKQNESAVWPDRQPCLPLDSVADTTHILNDAAQRAAWGHAVAQTKTEFNETLNSSVTTIQYQNRMQQEKLWSDREEARRLATNQKRENTTENTLWREATEKAYEEAKLATIKEFYAAPQGVRDDETVPRGVVQICRNDNVQECELKVPDEFEQPRDGTPHSNPLYPINWKHSGQSGYPFAQFYNGSYYNHDGKRSHTSEWQARDNGFGTEGAGYDPWAGEPTGYGNNGGADPYLNQRNKAGASVPQPTDRYQRGFETTAASSENYYNTEYGTKPYFTQPQSTPTHATEEYQPSRLLNTHPWRYYTCPENTFYQHLCKQQAVTTGKPGIDCKKRRDSPHWQCSHERWSNYCGSGDCNGLAAKEAADYQSEQTSRELRWNTYDSGYKRGVSMDQRRDELTAYRKAEATAIALANYKDLKEQKNIIFHKAEMDRIQRSWTVDNTTLPWPVTVNYDFFDLGGSNGAHVPKKFPVKPNMCPIYRWWQSESGQCTEQLYRAVPATNNDARPWDPPPIAVPLEKSGALGGAPESGEKILADTYEAAAVFSSRPFPQSIAQYGLGNTIEGVHA